MRKFQKSLPREDERVNAHQSDLEEELHRLDRHRPHLEDVLVPDRGQCREARPRDCTPHRLVAKEINAFVLSRPREHEVPSEDRQHPNRLDPRGNLPVEEKRRNEHERRSRRPDRRCNRNRQRPERIERKDPRGRHDRRLDRRKQQHLSVRVREDLRQFPADRNTRDERQTSAARGTEQDRQDRVVADARLLREIVKREKK